MGITESLFFTLLAIVGLITFGVVENVVLLPTFIMAYRPERIVT